VTADLDTRCGELYASRGEVLPAGQGDSGDAAVGGGGGRGSPGEAVGGDAFTASRERFGSLVGFLDGADAAGLSHAELEEHLDVHGRELLRCLLGDHLALRAVREPRLEQVTGDEGVIRSRVEKGHGRALETVFGTVSVERLAYRAPGVGNLHPADAALNLPVERHSHGLRKLCALESPRGSFAGAVDAIERQTGVRLGKRQVEELAGLAAMDFEDFYETRRPARGQRGDLLVLSADGKGVVMRADALRTRAPARPRAGPSPKLSGEDQQYRRRMAEIGAVYDAKPAPRTPADILTSAAPEGYQPEPGPVARNKWLTASVVKAPAEVIRRVFDEAERRDPKHRRTWVALVDGANHQIERIRLEARKREVTVTIVVDFVHVLTYLWNAAGCLHPNNDQAAAQWVHRQAMRVLQGQARKVAGAIRRQATNAHLDPSQRKPADEAATYLTNKAPYLDYPTALSNGWPIATGIVEGACRHLVKDRMDITGARWGLAGAEAILKLRAVIANNDFEEYWRFHLGRERHHVHECRYHNHTIPGQ